MSLKILHKKFGRVVLTQPPQKRTVFFYPDDRLFLQIPHTVYVVYYIQLPFFVIARGLQVGFSEKEITNLDSTVYVPPFSNIAVNDFSVCLGGGWPAPICCWRDISPLIDAVIGGFWQSKFYDSSTDISIWQNNPQKYLAKRMHCSIKGVLGSGVLFYNSPLINWEVLGRIFIKEVLNVFGKTISKNN